MTHRIRSVALFAGLVVAIVGPGAATTATAQTSVRDAIQALKDMRSITEIDLTLSEYRARLLDAKVKVDRSLERAIAPDAVKAAVTRALGYYVLAASAWQAKVGRDDDLAARVAANPLVSQCPATRAYLGDDPPSGKTRYAHAGVRLGERGIIDIWGC